MPTYEYRCANGHDFEEFFLKMSAAKSEVPCPTCGLPGERQMSAGGGLLFKGSGFYITDYGKDGKKAAPTSRGGSAQGEGAAGEGGKRDGGKSDGGKSEGGKSDGGKSDGGKSDGGKSDGAKADAPKSESGTSGSSKSDAKPASGPASPPAKGGE